MTKSEELLQRLAAGWCDAPVLAAQFNWKPHTLRAAISGIAKTHSVQRKRADGITSYRVPDFERCDDGQPSEQQEWHDYDSDC